MTTTDWIQFWLAIGTGILAIISTISIIMVSRQNKEIIETSKRPFIILFKDIISNTSPLEYLVLKNVGNTTAHITSIKYNQEKFNQLVSTYTNAKEAFIYLNNSYIAPNQSYKIPIKTKDSGISEIIFEINYTNGKKKYSDTFNVNLTQDFGIMFSKQNIDGKELKVISQTLQELVKRIS